MQQFFVMRWDSMFGNCFHLADMAVATLRQAFVKFRLAESTEHGAGVYYKKAGNLLSCEMNSSGL